jgi:hypothetical protein
MLLWGLANIGWIVDPELAVVIVGILVDGWLTDKSGKGGRLNPL